MREILDSMVCMILTLLQVLQLTSSLCSWFRIFHRSRHHNYDPLAIYICIRLYVELSDSRQGYLINTSDFGRASYVIAFVTYSAYQFQLGLLDDYP